MKQETSTLRKRITTAAVIAVGGTALFAGLKPGGNTNRDNHNTAHLNMDTNTTPAGVPGEPRGSGVSPKADHNATPAGVPAESGQISQSLASPEQSPVQEYPEEVIGRAALDALTAAEATFSHDIPSPIPMMHDDNKTPAGVPGEPRGSGGSPSYSRPEAGAVPSGIEQTPTEGDPDLTGLPIPDLGDHNHTPAGVPGENRG